MAAAMKFIDPASIKQQAPHWSPFRTGGTVLPPNVLLMAKLLALCFLLTGQWNQLSDHFLPFLPVFEHAGTPAMFQRSLQVLFLIAAASLLFNQYVRSSCLVLGCLIFIAILSSRLYYESNRMFTGCLWFLAGLQVPGQKPWLIRYQVVVLYFGAALNKLLDADWRSGRFFENMVVHLVRQPIYVRISSCLPSMWLSALMSWTTIVTEFVLAAGFLARRFFLPTTWVGIAYHTALMLSTGRPFGMFYYATLSSYLAFVDWPLSLTIFYTGDDVHYWKVRSALEKIDLEGTGHWINAPKVEKQYKAREHRILGGLHVSVREKTYSGLTALYVTLLYNPLTYFTFAIILSLPRSTPSQWRNLFGIVFLLFMSPALLAPVTRIFGHDSARYRYM